MRTSIKVVLNVAWMFIFIASVILAFGYFYDSPKTVMEEDITIPSETMRIFYFEVIALEKLHFLFSADKEINLFVFDSTNYHVLLSGSSEPSVIFFTLNEMEAVYTLRADKTDTYYFILNNLDNPYSVDVQVVGIHEELLYSGLMPVYEIPGYAITVGVLIIIASVLGGLFFYTWDLKQQRKKQLMEELAKHAKFEREQLAKGLIKFIDDDGVERWGTPEQVKEWQREKEARIEREKDRLREIEEKRKAVLVKETTIIKEVVKVRCPYCGRLYDQGLNTCPHCGAPR